MTSSSMRPCDICACNMTETCSLSLDSTPLTLLTELGMVSPMEGGDGEVKDKEKWGCAPCSALLDNISRLQVKVDLLQGQIKDKILALKTRVAGGGDGSKAGSSARRKRPKPKNIKGGEENNSEERKKPVSKRSKIMTNTPTPNHDPNWPNSNLDPIDRDLKGFEFEIIPDCLQPVEREESVKQNKVQNRTLHPSSKSVVHQPVRPSQTSGQGQRATPELDKGEDLLCRPRPLSEELTSALPPPDYSWMDEIVTPGILVFPSLKSKGEKNVQIGYNGFIYVHHRTSIIGKQVFSCRLSFRKGCKARIHINPSLKGVLSETLASAATHNHGSEEDLLEARYHSWLILDKASQPGEERNVETIYKSELASMSATSRGLVPHLLYFQRKIAFARRKKGIKLPRVISDQSGSVLCDLCGVAFTHFASLRNHALQLHGVVLKGVKGNEPTFHCSSCNKSFWLKGNLEDHFDKVHKSMEERLTCDLCPPSGVDGAKPAFPTLSERLEHTRRVHEDKVTYPCDLCGKRFITATYLGKHFKAKHGVKERDLVSCDKCGVPFSGRDNLLKHKITCTKNGGDCGAKRKEKRKQVQRRDPSLMKQALELEAMKTRTQLRNKGGWTAKEEGTPMVRRINILRKSKK